jgi:hypothetical protein
VEVTELSEVVEKSKESGERQIGLSMAIFAVLLATATMLGHRAHTEEVVLQTQAADQWNYYQAKDIRSHAYDADSNLAKLFGAQGTALAADFAAQSVKQRNDADKIQEAARDLEKEVAVTSGRAKFYDGSELMLEVAIVLCSISLLSRSPLYWQISFLFAGGGLLSMLWGYFVAAH